MKDLKQYIIESQLRDSSLTQESLLDDEDDLAMETNSLIINFLRENYTFGYKPVDQPDPSLWVIDGDVVNVKVDVVVENKSIESLTNGLFRFGYVGRFSCSNCTNLKSLEGAPEYVGTTFTCDNCTSLKSLEGGPKYIGLPGHPYSIGYYCANCTSLESLKGAPIGNVDNSCTFTRHKSTNINKPVLNFAATNCSNIRRVDWGIKELRGSLNMVYCDLDSLEGCPQKITESFNISRNPNLKSLKGGPKKIGEEYYAAKCESLKDLEGCAEMVSKNGHVTYNFNDCLSLETLKGIPDHVHSIRLKNCPNLHSLSDLLEVNNINLYETNNINKYTLVPNTWVHGGFRGAFAILSIRDFHGELGKKFKEKGFAIKMV